MHLLKNCIFNNIIVCILKYANVMSHRVYSESISPHFE